MKKQFAKLLLPASVLLMITGCATALNFSELGQKKIYGGVRQSVSILSSVENSLCTKIDCENIGIKCLFFIDSPISLIADTLTLPITVHSYYEKPIFYKLLSYESECGALGQELTETKKSENIIENRKVRGDAYKILMQTIDDLLAYHKKYEDYQLTVKTILKKYHDTIGYKFGEVFVKGLKHSSLTLKNKTELIRAFHQPTAITISATVYQYSKELGINDVSAEYERQQEVLKIVGAYLKTQNKSRGDISALYRQNRDDERYWSIFLNKYSFGYEHALVVDMADGHVTPIVPVKGGPQ